MTGIFSYLAGFLTNVSIWVLFTIGLNLQFGYTGLINFGHVAFYALGAYAAAMLTLHGVPIVFAILAGVVLAAVCSLLLGLPSLRLREDYLAIVTIGFGEVMQKLLNGLDFTGGPQGVIGYHAPFIGMVSYEVWRWVFFGLCVVLTGIVFLLVERLVHSPWGRVLKGIREDEDVTVALGKNVVSYKLTAFAMGCGIAGLAGALFAYFITSITPHTFTALVTFEAWTIMVLGGSGRNWGVVVGAALYYLFYSGTALFASQGIGPFGPSQIASLRIAFIGLLLVLLMMYRPQGILGNKEELSLDR